MEAAAAGDIELVTFPALLAELRDVLGREHLATRLAQQRSSVEQAIRFYSELAISVSPLLTPRVVPGDVDDDHVIAAAVTGGADIVVSGDRHLLSMSSHQGIGIVNAAGRSGASRTQEAKADAKPLAPLIAAAAHDTTPSTRRFSRFT